jgi:hypothetical protein
MPTTDGRARIYTARIHPYSTHKIQPHRIGEEVYKDILADGISHAQRCTRWDELK